LDLGKETMTFIAYVHREERRKKKEVKDVK